MSGFVLEFRHEPGEIRELLGIVLHVDALPLSVILAACLRLKHYILTSQRSRMQTHLLTQVKNKVWGLVLLITGEMFLPPYTQPRMKGAKSEHAICAHTHIYIVCMQVYMYIHTYMMGPMQNQNRARSPSGFGPGGAGAGTTRLVLAGRTGCFNPLIQEYEYTLRQTGVLTMV